MNRHFFSLPIRLSVAVGMLMIAIFGTISARAASRATIYLPIATAGKATVPAGNLPAELVGTWFNGSVLNLQFFDRTTGMWSDPGGLGHMYVFQANGNYTLVSYLKLGAGTTCVSTVAKYHTGTARVEGASLLLTPNYVRTRTQVCGSAPVETEGPYATTTLPWHVGEDAGRHTKLWLAEPQGETEYYKDGIGPQVLGDWASGDGAAIGLYDPSSDAWVEPTGRNSEWYEFNGDGSYYHGEINAGFGDDPCRLVTMRFEFGSLAGSGSVLTLQPKIALRHVVSLCDPFDVQDSVVPTNDSERWTWGFAQREDETGLALMRVSGEFRQRFLLPVR